MTDHARPELSYLRQRALWVTLLALASSIHVFESSLPALGPWFKLGLANGVTLVALAWLGMRAALLLAVCRVVVGSFFIGTLFTPTFFIALLASMAAALMMVLVFYVTSCGLISISMLCAGVHMCTQFFVVEYFFIQQATLYYALAPLLVLSCFSGWFNGAWASMVVDRLDDERK
ncbi:MAG: Gx transporter family protein [Mariprofundaceae bacterium]|nr:Gx transporter family protein [Mariprofundaceae bacterium]